MYETKCLYCGKDIVGERKTKKYCSNTCAQRYRRGYPTKRKCRVCCAEFSVLERSDANRRYCSQKCSKKAHRKKIMDWNNEHPEKMKEYNSNRKAKKPSVWRDKHKAEREETIVLLGGACIVCGVSNPSWLHIDYIPTTRNKVYRHPRHLNFIKKNTKHFRLLCANHHYELTLTGKIEGTDITQ